MDQGTAELYTHEAGGIARAPPLVDPGPGHRPRLDMPQQRGVNRTLQDLFALFDIP
jgi:hypothetical protein